MIEFFVVFVLHAAGRITVSEPSPSLSECVAKADDMNRNHEWMKDPRAKEYQARFECVHVTRKPV